MTAPVELLPPAEAVHGNERWYELRRQGITASEIAAVLGISPYESPFSLYWGKVNDWRREGNEFSDTGRHLEASIADWWQATRRNAAIRSAGLYAHPDRPWQLATPDRLIHAVCPECRDNPAPEGPACRICGGTGLDSPTLALLECKWVAYSWDGWGEPGTDEIPVHYRAQCLWQADVMGVDEVHVAALGPGGFRAYLIRVDERAAGDLRVMRGEAGDFVRRLTEGDPPPLDSHTATIGALKRLHPAVGEGDVEVPDDLAYRYRFAREQRAEAEQEITACEAEIRAALGSTWARATFEGGKPLASRSVFDVERIDVARLRAERPEIAAAYTTKTTTDRLNPARGSRHA